MRSSKINDAYDNSRLTPSTQNLVSPFCYFCFSLFILLTEASYLQLKCPSFRLSIMKKLAIIVNLIRNSCCMVLQNHSKQFLFSKTLHWMSQVMWLTLTNQSVFFQSKVVTLPWLDVASHVICFNQSECIFQSQVIVTLP